MALSTPERTSRQTRTYDRGSSVVFFKTKESFGGLSNMAGGFPLQIKDLHILTSEALYQACRFPHLPDVQRLIIGQPSPMTAKMKSKPYRHDSRRDWNRVRVAIMRWCLRVKLAQNWDTFSKLLLSTGELPIVEQSRKDGFWGVKSVDERTLVGMNVLGRLLMELRELVKSETRYSLLLVEPLKIPNFLLVGFPIERIVASQPSQSKSIEAPPPTASPSVTTARLATMQLPLDYILPSDEPSLREEFTAYRRANGTPHLKPYPTYKDSDVEWFGPVPEHWQVVMAKRHYAIQLGKMLQSAPKNSKDTEAPYLKAKHVQWFRVEITDIPTMWASRREIEQFSVLPNDLLVCEGGEGGRCGIVHEHLEGCIIQNALHRVRPKRNSSNKYLQYVLSSVSTSGWFDALNDKATIAHFTSDKFGSLRIPKPPLLEQTAIARFLDHVDRRIQRYIRSEEKLIALLEEQKQALIYQAATGRIDVRTQQPYPTYKDSDVEWFGPVPEHWQVVMAKRHYAIQLGKMLQSAPKNSKDTEAPYLKAKHVQWFRVEITDIPTMWASRREIEQFSVLPNDLLVCEGGEGGRCGIVHEHLEGCIIQNALHRVRPKRNSSNKYLQYVLSSVSTSGWFDALNDKATIAHFTSDKFGSLRIPKPPLLEQTAIARFLDQAAARINAATTRAHHQIEFLREYRTRLIADIVNGKLDVREVVDALCENYPIAARLTESMHSATQDVPTDPS